MQSAYHIRVESAWPVEDGQFKLDVAIPPNTTAETRLPGDSEPIEVESGNYRYAYDWSL